MKAVRSIKKSAAALAVVTVMAGGAWAGEYTLEVNINPPDGGTVSINPKMDSYVEWADVKVTAIPKARYSFDGWSGESTAKTTTISIEMSGSKNKKLTANFKAVATSTFKDNRDDKTYKKVTIGDQTWMAENLNFGGIKSACYENKEENCAKYGRMYRWEEATKACPAGWHLSSDDEWNTLTKFVGSPGGTRLKSTDGWNSFFDKSRNVQSGNGTDHYGFMALPGGVSNGSAFDDAGNGGRWWGSENYRAAERAWYWRMSRDREGVAKDGGDKSYLFSVRCVQD